MRYYAIMHALGTHSWDIPALAVGVILLVVILVHCHNQKKRDNDFEGNLEEKLQEIKADVRDEGMKSVEV